MSTPAPREIAAGALVRPAWQRLRVGLVLALVIVLGAVLVGSLADRPGQPLDPISARTNGSKALVRILAGYGATVVPTTDLNTAIAGSGTVLVTAPDAYSTDQLQRLAAAPGRLVLVEPGTRATTAVAPGVSLDPNGRGDEFPGCRDAGAIAAGRVALPDDVVPYNVGRVDATSCYGGAVVSAPNLVLLGSAKLLQNDTLAGAGVAALDVNAITADRTVRDVVWLRPGGDAAGSGPASIWDLFPDGAYRAFWWLIAVGALLVLWRARRLGGVVTEPLPVIVRSAEVVEGHGRLYLRAGARDRAAAALRAAAKERIRARVALPRGATPDQVAVAVAPVVGRSPAEVAWLLGGPAPADDAMLLRLAIDLDRLETAVGGAVSARVVAQSDARTHARPDARPAAPTDARTDKEHR
jgi:hypothetical protein